MSGRIIERTKYSIRGSMMKKVNIVIVGIGGYANLHVEELINNYNREEYEIVGVVDPKPENCLHIKRIDELNIPKYKNLEEFYSAAYADLAIISSPIQFHKEQVCLALSKGSHVLCEKPLSASVEDALAMIEAKNNAKRLLAIGYQWSYSTAIQRFKQDILSGKFGKALTFKTIVLWPRDLKYYSRSWAGKKYDENGNAIFDSVVNNATAHYLHNMFYVLGCTLDSSEMPVKVEAELYRANDIENFDTAIIRSLTEKNVEIFFYASHAVKTSYGPVFSYEFENGTVSYGDADKDGEANLTARFKDGTVQSYGNPSEDDERKLWTVIDAVRNNKVIPCGAEAAFAQTLCVDMAQKSVENISTFPEELIRIDGEGSERRIIVEGLDEALMKLYLGDGSTPSNK
jgi:predicted dehydrogenase